jgi:hypothetical protein
MNAEPIAPNASPVALPPFGPPGLLAA